MALPTTDLALDAKAQAKNQKEHQVFDNQSVIPLRERKPHIVYREGYWRVSPLVKPRTPDILNAWKKAHQFINTLNDTRHLQR